MKLLSYALHVAKKTIPVSVVSGLVTAVFYCVIFGVVSVFNVVNGFLTGSVISFFVGFYLSISSGQLRKFPVVISFLINSLVSFIMILLISTFINMCFGSFSRGDFKHALFVYFTDYNFLMGMSFGGMATLLFVFVREIILLLGDVTFFRFITGRYHRPRKENMAVMFVDLVGSTSIAERIGEEKFLSFISEFFCDLASAIIVTGAEIHKYVGDEAIIVWSHDKAFIADNCIRFYEITLAIIRRKREHYIGKYGVSPDFRAGLHYGSVVAGEVGNVRKEIAYLGDVINTTARIIAECKTFKTGFLCSREIVTHLLDQNKVEVAGELVLRGKEKPTTLYALRNTILEK